jgi:flagellar hook-length control protein FliK
MPAFIPTLMTLASLSTSSAPQVNTSEDSRNIDLQKKASFYDTLSQAIQATAKPNAQDGKTPNGKYEQSPIANLPHSLSTDFASLNHAPLTQAHQNKAVDLSQSGLNQTDSQVAFISTQNAITDLNQQFETDQNKVSHQQAADQIALQLNQNPVSLATKDLASNAVKHDETNLSSTTPQNLNKNPTDDTQTDTTVNQIMLAMMGQANINQIQVATPSQNQNLLATKDPQPDSTASIKIQIDTSQQKNQFPEMQDLNQDLTNHSMNEMLTKQISNNPNVVNLTSQLKASYKFQDVQLPSPDKPTSPISNTFIPLVNGQTNNLGGSASMDFEFSDKKSLKLSDSLDNTNPNLGNGLQFREQLQQTTQETTVNPSQTTQINTPMSSPDWGPALNQRVTWMVRDQMQNATITINPPHLGPIEVRLQTDALAQTSVQFFSNNADVRQAITDQIPHLRTMMSQSGLQLGQADVNSGNQQAHQQSANSYTNSKKKPAEFIVPEIASFSSSQRVGLINTYV